MLKEAYVAERQGRYGDSIRCVRRAARLLDPIDGAGGDALRARLTIWEAAVRATQGRFGDALRAAARGIDLSREVGDESNLRGPT